ncbi:oxygenase MpaB family protein [Agromyces sp. LHK192]|uniref:oxygenase MpaB family protein n=1 Tax=Agromyces sp. LHK192 TaxID=2498704 RepID=UPI001F0B9E46|nr:oxygenase MpaB family protein [Agromyces sp. LHK192]
MDAGELEVFRRHAGDATLLAGGAAAILLQLADPRVARGVARHSAFRTDPLARLRGTLDYVHAIGFGDERIRQAAAAAVDERHRPVRGAASASAPSYSAFDRDAQRFVASTLLAVGLDLEERLAGPLDPPTADILVRGYGDLAANLQARSAGWPSTRAEFDRWWRSRLSTLKVGDEARDISRALLVEPELPGWMRLALPPVRLVTAALLPAQIRAAYGFRFTPRVARAADGWFTALRVARVVLPDRVRRAPMRESLRRAAVRSRYAESGIGTG